MDTVIVIMQKDKETGFLEKEMGSLIIDKNSQYLVNIFAVENAKMEVHLKITTDRDVEDWEYNAIFDYYDTEKFNGVVNSISEVEDDYNPTWELIFDYPSDIIFVEDKVCEILEIHKEELNEVYGVIKDKKGEYDENEKE